MRDIETRPKASPPTPAERARAAELGGTPAFPGPALISTRAAFLIAEREGARARAEGYRSVGRMVRRCGDE